MLPTTLVTALLVLMRMTGLVLVVPGAFHHVVTLRIRGLMIVLLAATVLCVIPPLSHSPPTDRLVMLMIHELVVGISLGFIPAVIAWGLQVSVQALHGMTGLSSSGEATGNATSDAPLQRLFVMVVLAVFFLSAGHRMLLEAVLESFSWLPVGQFVPLESTKDILMDMLSASFALGVRAMAPIAVCLAFGIMVTLLISRSMPQLSYFAVGMSIQSVLLIASLCIFSGAVIWLIENGMVQAPMVAKQAWLQIVSSAP